MVKTIASRAAGFSLVKIIALLLVPIVYFSWIVVHDFLHEHKLAHESRNGLALMELTFRVMQDASEGWSQSDHKTALLRFGPGYAADTHTEKAFQKLVETLKSEPVERGRILDAAQSLLWEVGNGAAGSETSSREANGLARIAGGAIPGLMAANVRLNKMTQEAMADLDAQPVKFREIGTDVASLDFQAKSLTEMTIKARDLGHDTSAYSPLLVANSKLGFDASYFNIAFFDGNAQRADSVRKLFSASFAQNHEWNKNLGLAWDAATKRLATLVDEREAAVISAAWKRLGLALAAVVLGLGTALSMFRSSLKKLDEVEKARQDANLAREDAERGAQELAQINDHMGKVNRELDSNLHALREAQGKLLEKGRMEQLGTLTATIAHELRNPLGAVRTSVFLLDRKTAGHNLGIEGQIKRINNGVSRCDNIISQLLDFSRVKSIEPRLIDFDGWLERVAHEESKDLPEHITITCQLGAGSRSMHFDPTYMQRAVHNLMLNACEALLGGPDGAYRGVVSNPRIELASAVEGNVLLISVNDNGHGISEENLKRVREPLFTTKSFGTGLGLPAVEQILAQHGGSLKISSVVGKGTWVTMRLPIVEERVQAA